MSGGCFNYNQYHLLNIKEDIDKELLREDSYITNDFSRKAVRDIASDLEAMYYVLHALDYWLEGDTGEKDFTKAYNLFRSQRSRVNLEE